MFYYGGTVKVGLTRDVLSCILNELKEEQWYKLKWNSKILVVIKSLHKRDTLKNLAKRGCIESLGDHEVDLKYICQSGSLNVCRRYIHGKYYNWDRGLHGAWLTGNKEIIRLMFRKGAIVSCVDWMMVLFQVARSGNMELFNVIMGKSIDDYYIRYATKYQYDKTTMGDIMGLNQEAYDMGLRGACRCGKRDMVDIMILKGGCYWQGGLAESARSGHKDLVELMIKKASEDGDMALTAEDWDRTLRKACRGGNKDLCQLILEKGADDFNGGLRKACRGGHLDIINLMIERGANDWNGGMNHACRGGHGNIVKLMIEKGATSWDEGLTRACHGDHIEIAELMISMSFGGVIPVNAFFASIMRGNIYLVELMIKHGANYWNTGLRCASDGNPHGQYFVQLMINNGANYWDDALFNAARRGNKELVDFMILKGASDWNAGLVAACRGGHQTIAELMINKGATCFDEAWKEALYREDTELLALLTPLIKTLTPCNVAGILTALTKL